MKKILSFITAVSLVFLASFVAPKPVNAAETVTLSVVSVVSSNQINVKVLGDSGRSIATVDPSKFHIDVNTGGVSPLTPTGVIIDEADFDSGAQFRLSFAGTPFSATDTSYDASHGLYIDASGVIDSVGNTNVVVAHGSSVAILDSQIPVLDPISIASDGVSASYAKVGDTVTVTFTSTEPLDDTSSYSAFTSGSNPVFDDSAPFINVSGDIWSFSYTTDSTDAEGLVAFEMEGYDLAGNVSAFHTSTTDFSAVRFDKTAPVISEVTPVTTPSTDTSPAYTFTTDEDGTISYGGSCASASTSAASGSNTISFAELPNGTYTNCTITVADYAGNDSNTITVTSFTITSDVPTLTLSSTAAGYTSTSPIPMTASFSEDVSGFAAGDIIVSNGSISNFVSSSASLYTFDVTPASPGKVTVNVGAGAAMDSNTNNSLAATQFRINYTSTSSASGSGYTNDVNDIPGSTGGTIITPTTPSGTCATYLTTTLKQGDRNESVTKLQQFLASESLFTYPSFTTFFGPITFQAVKDFQQKYAADILAPIGLSMPTGFVGPMTLAKINQISCGR